MPISIEGAEPKVAPITTITTTGRTRMKNMVVRSLTIWRSTTRTKCRIAAQAPDDLVRGGRSGATVAVTT